MMQAANYLLPLITLPYLVRVLGPSDYGLVAFAQAFIGYFGIFTDYGFNLTATREIAIGRDDMDKVSRVFFSVLAVKIIFLLVSLCIISAVIFISGRFSGQAELCYFTFGTVIGQAMFPVWFFQGMEKMRYITVLNLLSRFIYTVCIFVFIRKASDYIYVPLVISSGQIIAAVIALRVVFARFDIRFYMPKAGDIARQLSEGFHVFISNAAISLYTTSSVFILGLFAAPMVVGYYAAAEKIVRALQNLLSPAFTTIYPYISRLAAESKERAIKFIRKSALIIGIFYFAVSVGTFVFARYAVALLLGSGYGSSVVILRILAFLPFIIGMSNIFGLQTMLPFNYKKQFSAIYIAAGLLNIIFAFTLVLMYNAVGISVAVLLSESFVAVSMFLFLRRKGIRIFSGKIISEQ